MFKIQRSKMKKFLLFKCSVYTFTQVLKLFDPTAIQISGFKIFSRGDFPTNKNIFFLFLGSKIKNFHVYKFLSTILPKMQPISQPYMRFFFVEIFPKVFHVMIFFWIAVGQIALINWLIERQKITFHSFVRIFFHVKTLEYEMHQDQLVFKTIQKSTFSWYWWSFWKLRRQKKEALSQCIIKKILQNEKWCLLTKLSSQLVDEV